MFVIEKKLIERSKMNLNNYQIIKENGAERFAVIDYSDFVQIKKIFSNTENLQSYLDYLHIQEVKSKNEKKFSLDEARNELGI